MSLEENSNNLINKEREEEEKKEREKEKDEADKLRKDMTKVSYVECVCIIIESGISRSVAKKSFIFFNIFIDYYSIIKFNKFIVLKTLPDLINECEYFQVDLNANP